MYGPLIAHAQTLTTLSIAWVSSNVFRFFGRLNRLSAVDKSDHEGASLSLNDSSGRQADRQAGRHIFVY